MTAMTPPRASACTIVDVERRVTAVVKAQVPMDMIPQAQRTLRAKIADAVATLGLQATGETCTLWRPPVDGFLYMEPGTVVAQEFRAHGDVVASALPAGRAAHFLLVGGFEGLAVAWGTLLSWCEAEGLALAGVNWEVYAPAQAEPALQETRLYALLA
jgi:effector-binding domain-containing protein